MRRTAPYIVSYIAAAVLFIAAVLTLTTGGVALWQPITLLATSALFAALAVYSHRRAKRRAA